MIDRESRRVLELARAARTPSAADKADVERKLAAALGLWGGTVAATAAAEAASKAGAAKTAVVGALKWWLAGGALIGAAATGYVALSAPSAAVPKATAAHVQHGVPAVAPAAPAAKETAPTAEAATAVPAEPVAVAATVPTVAPRTHRVARVERAQRGGQPHASLASELDLLHGAQVAWRAGQPGAALALLDEHRTRFARSSLALERDALRALCLCEQGRSAEATQLARGVLARAPHSPLRAALEQSCALR